MNFKKNFQWNLLGAALPFFAGFFAVPILLSKFGNERFGLLTIIWVLVGYLSLFDLGIGRALTYNVKIVLSARGDNPSSLRSLVLAGLLLSIVAGTIGTVAALLVPDKIAVWLSVSDAFKYDLIDAFSVCAITIVPIAAYAAIRGALEGLGRFDVTNLGKIVLGVGVFVVPLTVSLSALGNNGTLLRDSAIGILVLRIIVTLSSLIILITETGRAQVKAINDKTANYVSHVKKILGYGSWVTVTSTVGPIMVYGDRFIISNIVGPEVLSFYSLPQEFIVKALIIPSALFGALLPDLVGNHGDSLKSHYEKRQRLNFKIMAGLTVVSLICVYPGLLIWLGREFAEESILPALILIFGTFINGLAQGPYTLLLARGRPDMVAKLHLLELFFYLIFVYLAVSWFGIVGAAGAWTFRALIDFFFLKKLVSWSNPFERL